MVKMLAVISPAKTLDFETESPVEISSDYRCQKQASALMSILRDLSAADIKKLMKISDKLAELNSERFANWQESMTLSNSKQALFAFQGDVYTGLSAHTLTEPQILAAQDHLRILSGLYGLLRPMDRIQPYRLEMGTRLTNPLGSSLYDFWGSDITELLNLDIEEQGVDVLLNLASTEYFKAVKASALSVPIVTPVFKDEKNGQYKIISFFAKKARGLMVRYLLEQQPQSLQALKDFDYAGYQYCAEESDEHTFIYKRPEKLSK